MGEQSAKALQKSKEGKSLMQAWVTCKNKNKCKISCNSYFLMGFPLFMPQNKYVRITKNHHPLKVVIFLKITITISKYIIRTIL